MDPGTALGAVSLLFQVFSGCVAAYHIASEAKGLEKSRAFIRVRFKTEQYRLLDWGRVARLSEQDGIFSANRSNRAVVMEVLDQQYHLIMGFERLDDRFQGFSKETLFKEELAGDKAGKTAEVANLPDAVSTTTLFPDSNELLQRALKLTEKTRKLPRRLRWAVSDRQKMEDLLSRLAIMNDSLRDMLDTHQMHTLRIQQVRTDYQVIQLNNKLDHLLDIIQAGLAPRGHAPLNGRAPQQTQSSGNEVYLMQDERKTGDLMQHLVQLAQFKAVSSAVEEQSFNDALRGKIGIATKSFARQDTIKLDAGALELDAPGFMISAEDVSAHPRRVSGWYQAPLSKHQRCRVWIEWKRLASQYPYETAEAPDPAVLRRFEALVELLRENQVTAQFRAPKCLGYYLQQASPSGLRYGLVFETPRSIHGNFNPVSLRDLITDIGRRVPSLTARVRLIRALVECVERIHAVNWLHKGLCSDNIIFFQDASDDTDTAVDLTKPFLSGFDYSRPVTSVSMSEGPPVDLAEDLYRHPNVQGLNALSAAGRGHRKRHDIYSLGLALVEICYWKPLESIIGVHDVKDLKARDVLNVREMLLSQSHQESIQSRVGDTIAQAIQACLEGVTAFGQLDKADEEDVLVAEHLQRKFYEVMVQPLNRLMI